MTERRVVLDLELIGALKVAVPVPLALHGSSGVPDQELLRAVQVGMAKINIATQLNRLFTESIRATLAADPGMVDSPPIWARRGMPPLPKQNDYSACSPGVWALTS